MESVMELRSDACVLGAAPDDLRVVPARVRIRGRWIEAVEEEPAGEANRPFDGIDLGSRLVSPAFVNAHTHLSMNAFRGLGGAATFEENVVEEFYYRIESSLDAASIAAFTRMGAIESLLAGVGLVWDHYYHGKVVAETLADVGLAGVVAPTLQDLAGPGVESWELQLAETREIDQSQALASSAVAAALGPHATDTVSDALFERVAEVASESQLPIHVHTAQSFREFQRSVGRSRRTAVGRLEELGVLASPATWLLIHGIFLTESDLRCLDPARHALGYCPFSQMQFAFPANVYAWERAGLPWFVATDCGASNDSMNLQKELRLVAGQRGFRTTAGRSYREFTEEGGLERAEAVERERRRFFDEGTRFGDPAFLLSRVWSVPGRLHPRLPAGVLAPNHLANLVIWDPRHAALWPGLDPLRALAMNDCTGAIDGLLVAGRWVGERGRFRESILESAAYDEVRREASARLQEHRRKWGL